MTRTLVTGTNGFIGRPLVAELLARGVCVSEAVRRAMPLPSRVECPVVGELGACTDWLDALADATSVVHLTARAHVLHYTATGPLATSLAINIACALNLVRQAAEAGASFFFVSTLQSPDGQSLNGKGTTSEAKVRKYTIC